LGESEGQVFGMEDMEKQNQWVDTIAIVLALIGALASTAGAALIGLSQIQATGMSLWPLPGLVLLDWLILGIAGILGAFQTVRSADQKWLQAIWLVTGAFVPLIILGAFSIGPFVLITYVLYLISTLILAVRRHPKWLECFGSFLLGLSANLGILLIVIYLGQPGK